jgi:heterodisulfide reductase subunit C
MAQLKTPGTLPVREGELRKAFLTQVDVVPGGERLRKCIQCGTCTGSCPVSYAMDISPREVIARFRAGDIETILRSRTIWICASCYACTVRCPVEIRITDLLYALKRVAMDKNIRPRQFPVYALSEAFVRSVKWFGRNFEAGLLAEFFLRSMKWMDLVKMAPLGLKMLRAGRMGIFPERIAGLKDLRKIIKRAEEIERPQERVSKRPVTDEVGYEAIQN